MAPRDDESFASLFEKSASARTGERKYQPGDRVEAVVVAVAREAVFVDLGGKQEGMFERLDLTDEEGRLRVEVGSRVSAVVKHVDFATGQVRLAPVAVRRTEDDAPAPAPAAAAGGGLIVEGARVKGKVTGIERYGVFVQIAGTNGRAGRGLVPTAETATPRGADLKKHFAVGQEVEAKIVNVEPETGRIRLSISALASDEERRDYEAFKSHAAPEAVPEGAAAPKGGKPQKKAPEPRSFGTLGDLLQKKPKR
ncbi:MAG TPA: S1 RNA-binding domain-containing protein [Minicystis sp.]|nr:S1 RNA-binding domain-containing protein [Minicystis sp.]